MSAPTSITKFYDAAERPPIMGWHYYDDPNDRGTYFREASADAVFERVKRLRVNNAKHVSDFDLWRELWSYWCSREPKRCGQDATEYAVAGVSPGPLVPRDINPPFFGPIIWRMMNLLAARFDSTTPQFFRDFLYEVTPVMTCPACRQEWAKILLDYSPESVRTAREACEWVNRAHNIVNERRGSARYSYEQGVAEYGWPV
jgi:hypothetical protein